jgi:phospholipid/cholesterol/gamma-HCH transport system ATP-binding protein
MKNLVEIRDLHYSRDDRIIFSGIDVDIPKGKITAIMGPSGTGKTTVLKLISRQLSPDRGSIKIAGEEITEVGQRELYELRKKMGMLFQNNALFTNMSVYDNVAFPLRENTNLPEQMIRDLVLIKLEAVGLRGAVKLMPNELSGGMARRIALARAIALDPELILYDEPFTGQDPISMGVLIKLIKTLNDRLGITSVLVSHDVTETLSIADYAYILTNSQVAAQGSPDSLKNSAVSQVRQFLEGLPDGPVSFHYPANNYIEDLME